MLRSGPALAADGVRIIRRQAPPQAASQSPGRCQRSCAALSLPLSWPVIRGIAQASTLTLKFSSAQPPSDRRFLPPICLSGSSCSSQSARTLASARDKWPSPCPRSIRGQRNLAQLTVLDVTQQEHRSLPRAQSIHNLPNLRHLSRATICCSALRSHSAASRWPRPRQSRSLRMPPEPQRRCANGPSVN